MPDQTIYEVMYPYCRGELLAFVTNAIRDIESFDNFLARLLEQFIPSRQICQLRQRDMKGCYLLQSIRDASMMLRTRENEAQVVERIVEELKSAQSARFVFQAPPSSLLQLEQQAVVDRNIAYAGQTRTVQSSAVTFGVIESHLKPGNSRYSHSDSRRTSRSGKPVVCFYCRKPGHIQKRCSFRLAQLRKSDRPVATDKP